MNDTDTPMARPGGRFLVALAAGLVAAAVTQTWAVTAGGWPAFNGEFLGPDAYMRMSRVLECRGGVDCPGGLFTRSNAPTGEILHWPFLQDWLLLALAAPLRPIVGDVQGITVAGYLFGPLLQGVATALILTVARPLVPSPGWGFAGLLLACQLWVMLAFAPARPDHHGLQAVLFLAAVAAGIRLLGGNRSRSVQMGAGAAVAVAVWVSVEGMLTAPLLMVALAAIWVVDGGRELLRVNRFVALTAVALLAVALMVDGPKPLRFAVEYDRLSIAYWSFFFFVVALWWLVEWKRWGGTRLHRAAIAVGGAVIVVGLLVGVFPGVLRGPQGGADPRIFPLWHDSVLEVTPLLRGRGSGATWVALGSLTLAVPVSAWAFIRSSGGARWGWGLVLACCLWFGLLGLVHGSRWVYYVHLLLPVPLAWVLGVCLQLSRRLGGPMRTALAQTLSVVVIAAGPLILVAALTRGAGPGGSPEGTGGRVARDTSPCQARDVVPSLAALNPEGAGRSVVVAPLFWGPEIVFRTTHDVVATPYHRNAAGMLASHRIMASADDRQTRDLLAERRIRYIVICRGFEWTPLLGPEVAAGSLFARLQRDDAPPFLVDLPLPPEVAEAYALWEVRQP